MQYRRLGNTGLIVSRMALGALTFGDGQGVTAALYKVDQAGAQRLVDRALNAGINYFNTADSYCEGRSEEMLGRALGPRRNQAVVATKVGQRTGTGLVEQGLSRRHIIAAADASLRRLRTDWIDVYLLHRMDPLTPVEETLAAMEQLVAAGKVRYVGFSNWPAWLAAKASGIQLSNGWEVFRAAEIYYSLLCRDVEHEIVPYALDAGVGVQVWGPLAGGFLSGRYSKQDPTGGGGRLGSFDLFPVDRERGYRIVESLQTIGHAHGVSPAQIALAWLLTRPAVTSILLGASRDDQLEDNLRAAHLDLTVGELAELDRLSEPSPIYPRWYIDKIFDPAVLTAVGAPISG